MPSSEIDTDSLITEIVKRLVASAHPRKVILFGSYARGNPGPDSDIDILVIEDTVQSRFKEMVRLRRTLRGIPIPIDVLVISKEEFEARAQVPSTVYYWVNREGRVLYEAA